MNNGYQKSNGCGADKEGGKIFNTFFYPELQSKHKSSMPKNYCARCGKPIAVDKWYLCEDCDRLQPRYLASKNNKTTIKKIYDFSK